MTERGKSRKQIPGPVTCTVPPAAFLVEATTIPFSFFFLATHGLTLLFLKGVSSHFFWRSSDLHDISHRNRRRKITNRSLQTFPRKSRRVKPGLTKFAYVNAERHSKSPYTPWGYGFCILLPGGAGGFPNGFSSRSIRLLMPRSNVLSKACLWCLDPLREYIWLSRSKHT